jgi:hypothetical protein
MFGAEHSQYDIDRAVEMATNWWEKAYKQEIIPDYITAIFECWKIDCGEARKGNSWFGELVGAKSVLVTDEEERWNLIENAKPWECMPHWSRKNPIDLLIHIWAKEYHKFDGALFYDALAWLIIDCAKQNNPTWRIPIVSASLRLADFHFSVAESRSKYIREEYVKQWPKIESYHKQTKGFVEELERKKENALQRGSEVRSCATELLENKKNPRSIVGIIASKTKYEKRTIRRDLEDHPSGHWKPKIKK